MRLAIALCCVVAAAQEETKPDPIDVQIERIEALAAAEPPIFAMDTRLRLAEALRDRQPKRAHGVLDRTVANLSAIHDQRTYARFAANIAIAMAHLDLDEAEHLAQLIPRNADPKVDFRAEAWDAIIERNKASAEAAITRAFAAGAFRLNSARSRLENLAKRNPGEATALLSQMIGACPENPVQGDAEYLGSASARMLELNEGLALEGLERALAGGWVPDKALAAALRSRYKEMYTRRRDQIDRQPEATKPMKGEPSIFDGLEKEGFDPEGASFSEALAGARRLRLPVHRVGALVRISRREDLTDKQRGLVAVEALNAAAKLDNSDANRLFVFTMLGRDFTKRGDRLHAERAARLLAESFDAFCRCDSTSCDSLEGKEDCADMVGDFADYLDEEEVTPEDLNIRNVSLSARVETIKLKRLLGDVRKKGFFR